MSLFQEQETVTLKVTGMHCPKCVAKVRTALEALEGVTKAEVSLEDECAVVTGGPGVPALVAAVEEAGFEASL